MSQNACIASRNVPNMYIGLLLYVQSNEKQVSMCPLSTNLIIEEVISVLPNNVTSAQVDVSREHKFWQLQFFNSFHAFEAFRNVFHRRLTSPCSSTSHPQSVNATDCSFNSVLFNQI